MTSIPAPPTLTTPGSNSSGNPSSSARAVLSASHWSSDLEDSDTEDGVGHDPAAGPPVGPVAATASSGGPSRPRTVSQQPAVPPVPMRTPSLSSSQSQAGAASMTTTLAASSSQPASSVNKPPNSSLATTPEPQAQAQSQPQPAVSEGSSRRGGGGGDVVIAIGPAEVPGAGPAPQPQRPGAARSANSGGAGGQGRLDPTGAAASTSSALPPRPPRPRSQQRSAHQPASRARRPRPGHGPAVVAEAAGNGGGSRRRHRPESHPAIRAGGRARPSSQNRQLRPTNGQAVPGYSHSHSLTGRRYATKTGSVAGPLQAAADAPLQQPSTASIVPGQQQHQHQRQLSLRLQQQQQQQHSPDVAIEMAAMEPDDIAMSAAGASVDDAEAYDDAADSDGLSGGGDGDGGAGGDDVDRLDLDDDQADDGSGDDDDADSTGDAGRGGRSSGNPGRTEPVPRTERGDAQAILDTLRTSSFLSLVSLFMVGALTCWAYFEVGHSSVLLILLLCLTASFAWLVALLWFYHRSLTEVLDPQQLEFRLPGHATRDYREYSNQFTHIVIACCFLVLIQTISVYQVLLVLVLRTGCADGIFSSFDLLTDSGKSVYILLFVNFAFSVVCCVRTIKFAYFMNLYYLKQLYLHSATHQQDSSYLDGVKKSYLGRLKNLLQGLFLLLTALAVGW